MKFKDARDFQLLRTCLKIKELKLTPELINQKNILLKHFSREDLRRIDEISEELLYSSLRGKNLSSESMRDLKSYMNSLPTKRSQADLVEYMDTYVTYAEFRRLQEMDLDSDRLAWLESYMIQADENQTAKKSETKELKDAAVRDTEDRFKGETTIIEEGIHTDTTAPTTRVARFATAMLSMNAPTIAHNYAKSIEAQKLMYRLNGQNKPELAEKLGTLQRHLLDSYPKNVKAPRKHEQSVIGNFLDDLRTGKDVRLAVANTAKTVHGRNVLMTMAAVGIITPLLALTLHAGALAKPANESTYQSLLNTPGIHQVFSERQLAEIRGYEEQFAKYEEEGIVPSTAELHGLLSSIDDFYSDSITGTLLESYNEYAEENNKPKARYINFAYDDTDKNDGPRNVLIVTDEDGKRHTVDTDSTNLLETNNISAIYGAERRIDGYRDSLNALPNAENKLEILSRVKADFYKVLDALTLDYTFERNGIVQRIFGDDFKLVSESQIDELDTTPITEAREQIDLEDDQR